MAQDHEPDPLSPTGLEIAITAVAVLHLALVAVLLVLVVLDRVRVPRGAIWVAILLLVPVLGPLTVLARGRRTPGE